MGIIRVETKADPRNRCQPWGDGSVMTYKHECLSSIPQHSHKAPDMAVYTCDLRAEEAKEAPWGLGSQLAWLA